MYIESHLHHLIRGHAYVSIYILKRNKIRALLLDTNRKFCLRSPTTVSVVEKSVQGHLFQALRGVQIAVVR